MRWNETTWPWLGAALLAAAVGCTSEAPQAPNDDSIAAAVGTVAETTARLESATKAAAQRADRDAERPDADAAASGGDAPPPDTRPRLPVPLDAPAFHVVSVDLGKAIDGANAIPEATESFAPRDTIYASVATEGVQPTVKLDARWTTTSAELVAEDSQTFSAKGPARAEFHVAHPRGWPLGRYRVEISVDGAVVETREFEVHEPAS